MTPSKFPTRSVSIQFFRILAAIVVLSLVPHMALAQTGRGTISGTVRDPGEAAVPAANVTITHTGTGISQSAQTNSVGLYYFGALPIGPYKVTIEKQGFDSWSGTLTLAVGQDAVVNASLKLGSTTTVVNVSDVVAPIETTKGEVGDVRESSQIRALPLNGR